jgi:hypothetical protein
MKLTRQEDVSMYFYLRDMVIGPQYVEVFEEEELVLAESGKWDMAYPTTTNIHPFSRGTHSGLGRGLLYFDLAFDSCLFGPEQDDMVRVYDGTGDLPRIDYSVNYLTGQVYSNLDLSDYSVDYYWHYVSVIDAWPQEDVPDLPVVSIELQLSESLPLQLGGGDIRGASWHVEIFANNKGERDDLMDVIFEGINLRRCPIYTFEGGLPLTREGLYNSDFVVEENLNYPSLFFENAKKSLTGLPSWGFYQNEVINKYRAAITFDTKAYKK